MADKRIVGTYRLEAYVDLNDARRGAYRNTAQPHRPQGENALQQGRGDQFILSHGGFVSPLEAQHAKWDVLRQCYELGSVAFRLVVALRREYGIHLNDFQWRVVPEPTMNPSLRLEQANANHIDLEAYTVKTDVQGSLFQ